MEFHHWKIDGTPQRKPRQLLIKTGWCNHRDCSVFKL